jgi:SAM-dependent methyltransferase
MNLCPEYDTFADYYDHVYPYRERPDIQFYVDLARSSQGPVMEMGCGTGRVLIPCARSGAVMVGADISRAMLDVCRRKMALESPDVQARVELRVADMRDFDVDRRFALIILPFRSFQHLETVAEQSAALGCLKRHLAPGGRLVLDLFNPSIPLLGDERWLAEPLVEPEVRMPDGRMLVRSLRVVGRDFLNQVQELEIAHEITWPDGRRARDVATTRLRYLFRYEAEHLLAREGLTVEALYGSYDRSPYGATYPGELIFVATVAR